MFIVVHYEDVSQVGLCSLYLLALPGESYRMRLRSLLLFVWRPSRFIYFLFFWFCFTKKSAPCLSSSLLPTSFIVVYLLAPEEDNFLSKVLVFPCFLVFRRIGEYISLDLFSFVSLISNCSLMTERKHTHTRYSRHVLGKDVFISRCSS